MILLSRLVVVKFQHWSMTNGKILPKLLNILLAMVPYQSTAQHNIVVWRFASGTLSSVRFTKYDTAVFKFFEKILISFL